MIYGKVIYILVLSLGIASSASAQSDNPDLLSSGKGVTISASSFFSMTPPGNIRRDILQVRWETDGEVIGAWLEVSWAEKTKVKEIWIINKATPHDIVLDPYMRTGNYFIPKLISIEFSDKSTVNAELRISEKYQIITLPKLVETSSLKFLIQKVWENSGKDNAGICKIKAFTQDHVPCFNVEVFGMYDVRDKQRVQSATIELVNPTNQPIRDAVLAIFDRKHKLAEIVLDEIPAKSSYKHQLWIPSLIKETQCRFAVTCNKDLFKTEQTLIIKPYRKSYFDGGTFDIFSTNHNDLGWLDIQSVTADYRSEELVLPAMEIMKKYPEFKYTMESVEYLKEFLKRHPEKEEEMAKFMREKRFAWGAGYIQNLQVHVGPEKLVRQFYYGKRWLKENFPGSDSRVYINTDVPGLTYQLPQILIKSGIDYVVQGRFPWGFYYWEGLDGSSIPVFAFRYAGPYGLMNPKNNKGWSKFADEREYYYEPRQLPKSMLYDFNADYLPPCEDLLPFARQQNKAMQEFATLWNEKFIEEPEKQINPPKIRFVEPEAALDEFFGKRALNIETVKGDWPMSWAYYDEPANREGLLMGRKGHNFLIAAEMMYSLLSAAKNDRACPRDKMDEGWLANCWPDHGWGGNRGTVTDSFYVESYKKSQKIGMDLVQSAGNDLLSGLAPGKKDQLPILVFNSLNWERTNFVTCEIQYPKHWSGCKLINEEQKDIPFEIIQNSPQQNVLKIAFYAENVPALGYKTYYFQKAPSFAESYSSISPDFLENEFLKVRLGKGGITSLYDKIRQKEILKTDKFLGGEIIQMTAPDQAWESLAKVTMDDFDRTNRHDTRITRAVASPVRYLVEQEATFDHFILRERFILGKQSKELQVEVDIVNWNGKEKRELRVVYPLKMDSHFKASYEIPFGTVEMGRDEIDYSYLPENYECQFNPTRYGRRDLPFREALNWVDVSTGEYKGHGCLFASDMTVHLFKDETENPVDYPLVQHVLLSTRSSLAWNPSYCFTQPGNHSYRMALVPHNGNWRFAYHEGPSFNNPLLAFAGKENQTGSGILPAAVSLLKIDSPNIVVTALKQSEDGLGIIVRFYEAEGKYTLVRIKSMKSFLKVIQTDMIEYDKKELAIDENREIQISIKPWEIVTLKLIMAAK